MGSVVFLLTVLDNPKLQRVAPTQTRSRFLPPALQARRVGRVCVYDSKVPKWATGYSSPLPAPRSLSCYGGHHSWGSSPEEPNSSGSDPGPDGQGLQEE